jgi:hypothetical protein
MTTGKNNNHLKTAALNSTLDFLDSWLGFTRIITRLVTSSRPAPSALASDSHQAPATSAEYQLHYMQNSNILQNDSHQKTFYTVYVMC